MLRSKRVFLAGLALLCVLAGAAVAQPDAAGKADSAAAPPRRESPTTAPPPLQAFAAPGPAAAPAAAPASCSNPGTPKAKGKATVNSRPDTAKVRVCVCGGNVGQTHEDKGTHARPTFRLSLSHPHTHQPPPHTHKQKINTDLPAHRSHRPHRGGRA
jgi:hypothetical protein